MISFTKISTCYFSVSWLNIACVSFPLHVPHASINVYHETTLPNHSGTLSSSIPLHAIAAVNHEVRVVSYSHTITGMQGLITCSTGISSSYTASNKALHISYVRFGVSQREVVQQYTKQKCQLNVTLLLKLMSSSCCACGRHSRSHNHVSFKEHIFHTNKICKDVRLPQIIVW